MQLQLPELVEVSKRCRRCGVPFTVPAGIGGRRPIYCSERCRRSAAGAQGKAWRAVRKYAGATPAEVACLTCGHRFTPAPRKAGRAPKFCSDNCRRARKLTGKRQRRRNIFT